MITFGPWIMPVQYTSIVGEHLATRERAGLFDTCHMGEIGFAGPGAEETLEYIFTAHVAKLQAGRARYGFLTTEEGTVVDDGVLYAMPDEESPPSFILCVNATDIAGDLVWIKENAAPDTVIEDLSRYTGKIDIQGPLSASLLEEVIGTPISLGRFAFDYADIAGLRVMLSRSGYTGEDGFEIFASPAGIVTIWERLLEAGEPHGVVPAGLGARDTLRTEACLPLYGHELSLDITPVEAGYEWALNFEKDFLGKPVLERQAVDGPARRIMPFRMTGRVPARSGYPVFAEGTAIGVVTSGTYLPCLGCLGGMCLIDAAWAREEQAVAIEVRNRRHEARLVARPLYTRRSVQ